MVVYDGLTSFMFMPVCECGGGPGGGEGRGDRGGGVGGSGWRVA